jgi:hypothetical protein
MKLLLASVCSEGQPPDTGMSSQGATIFVLDVKHFVCP